MRNSHKLILFSLLLTLSSGSYIYQVSAKEAHTHSHADKHDHSEKEAAHDEHEHSEEAHAEESNMSEKAIKDLNIEILEAGSAIVYEKIHVSGRIALNQNTTAQVKARFPGVIRNVVKEPGETVKAGDTLATIESNDSLQTYAIKSPISGTIITRNANMGELASDTTLFVVADLSKLWAELFIFSKDSALIKPGQKVQIQSLDNALSTQASLTLVLPTAEVSSQTLIARAVIDNADHHWRAGTNIRADIYSSQKEASLAVKTEALQRMEGKTVVFVSEPDGKFKMQPVEIGVSDPDWTEIRDGLSQGQRYVAKNSFVVKADIGKASAEHEH